MRIIAGRLKGRRLEGPDGPGVRPTSDRLRETLFNVLGDAVLGARVADVFAGTGAVGIEAISRGAVHVTFVELDRRVRKGLERNVASVGLGDACKIVAEDFDRVAGGLGSFEIVFLDPPYDVPDLDGIVAAAARSVAPAGIAILEHSRRRRPPETAGDLVRVRTLLAGDSALSFYQWPSPSSQAPSTR
jgi:16S rRNA (guanine(966)-N(2))-methyltransferase RsmD